MIGRMTVVMSPVELRDALASGAKITLVGSFWSPNPGGGRGAFCSGHIPNSVFCDPALSLAGVPSSTAGRNPMPDPDNLAQDFARWGINSDFPVVVYDEGRGLFAARFWWVLRWAGIENVRVLDGGLAAWRALDGTREVTGPGSLPRYSNLRPHPGQQRVVDIEEVRRTERTLIDARDTPRFTGRKESLDLKAGHVPGAVNVPVRSVLTRDNRLRSSEEIREVFERAAIPDLADAIVYSGSGNHSAQLLLAMEHAGLPIPAHFVGGWSQWCADPANPVERGPRESL